jgi:hypothetical protein
VKPFHFHEPKNDPNLRKHLNAENPQSKKLKKSSSQRLNLDIMETENKPKPPSTAKFDAYVQMRRDDQHKKLQEKEQKAQEDEMRTLK